ncbi:hypothetical protein ABZ864_40450 [Streptomyces sp. NPDC047082]|uniref:hypothetical protein n=1 Tax=Streptomyces sp. NPDC047082 TaxID=3155259 RepID=UPI0033F56B97
MSTLAAAIPTAAQSTTITTAGLAVGIGILAVEHVRWWRGGGGAKGVPGAAGGAAGGAARDPKVMIPFWFGIAVGTLMVACPAGLLGSLAGLFRWGGNGLGGMVMATMTGHQASAIAQASAPGLGEGGAIVVTAMVIGLWLLRKAFPKATKGKWWKGVFTGTLITIGTGTFALIGNIVVPGANSLGDWALHGIVHTSIL